MSNLCGHCEHSADQHQMGWGRCDQECFDPEYGMFLCVCYHFEKQADA